MEVLASQDELEPPSETDRWLVHCIETDYEQRLFDPKYSEDANLKILREWEYVYFLIQRDERVCLRNYKDYDEAYLSKLRALGFRVPPLRPTAARQVIAYCYVLRCFDRVI